MTISTHDFAPYPVDMPADQQTALYALCLANDLPYSVVLALIEHESGFDPSVTSSAGAMGLMQIMPAAWTVFSVQADDDPYDPVCNMAAGCNMLAWGVAAYGDIPSALKAYAGWPDNGDKFVCDIMSRSLELRKAAALAADYEFVV